MRVDGVRSVPLATDPWAPERQREVRQVGNQELTGTVRIQCTDRAVPMFVNAFAAPCTARVDEKKSFAPAHTKNSDPFGSATGPALAKAAT